MTPSIVIFEDHSLAQFNPLALSVPTYEIRRGIFNLRERVELVVQDLNGTFGGGTLLCRPILAPLHTCEHWLVNPETGPSEQAAAGRFLWLNGRCAAQFSEIRDLLGSTSTNAGFLCVDEHGLVAAELNLKESQDLWQSWQKWISQPTTGLPEKKRWQGHECLGEFSAPSKKISSLAHIWDIVPATAGFLNSDISFLSTGRSFSRRPFGILPADDNPDPFWLRETSLVRAASLPELHSRFKQAGDNIWLGTNVQLSDSIAMDTSKGPIILDNGVNVMPHSFLEGPLYVGPGSRIKAGATIYGESSFGIGNRIAGEIGESTFSDFANKQHDGFIGHAVLGSWTNLGAMTTCSDLKNNYGNVRMDLGSGTVDTGLRFVGLMMGDHAKTAIGTLFNTGTCVGFGSNIFGGEMPPKYIRNFSWGGLSDSPSYEVEKAIETAAIVMSRRGCRLPEDGKKLMRFLS